MFELTSQRCMAEIQRKQGNLNISSRVFINIIIVRLLLTVSA